MKVVGLAMFVATMSAGTASIAAPKAPEPVIHTPSTQKPSVATNPETGGALAPGVAGGAASSNGANSAPLTTTQHCVVGSGPVPKC